MNEKNFNYLYSLLILNNINAGCKNSANDPKSKKTETTTTTTPVSGEVQGNNQLKQGNEIIKPSNQGETEEEKKKRLAEEEKKRKAQLEEERLTKIAGEVKKFFSVLNKVYVNKKTKDGTTNELIKAEIVDDKIKEFIKYLEKIDFSKDVQQNDIEILIKLLSIVKIENCNEDLNKFHNDLKDSKDQDTLCKNSTYFKYFFQLLSLGDKTDYNFFIIKDKFDNKIYFAIKDNDGNNIEINNKRYDIIQLMFNTFFVNYLQPSKDEKDGIPDEKMNFALNLGYNYLIDFKHCCDYFDKIIEHIGDSTSALPTNVKLDIYESSGENIEGTNNYIWANEYNYGFSNSVDANTLYDCQNIVKITTDKGYGLTFDTSKGNKKSKFVVKNAPFEISTLEKMPAIFEKLKDVNKINEVKNELLNLVKEDKKYSGQYITRLDYIPGSDVVFKEFKKENIENSKAPCNYNIYIYKDNNENNVDIKKWEDKEENNKIVGLINDFEKDLVTVFGGNLSYNFPKIVTLINKIKDNLKKDVLNQCINYLFSQILSNEEWDKLDTNNLCIKIANDFSSITISKNIEKAENFRVFSLNKQAKVSGPGDTKFKSEEKK